MPEALKDIAIESTDLAGQYANNHNSIQKRELTPLYQSIGGLAKAVDTRLLHLTARIEKLEAEAVTKPTVVAKSLLRKILDYVHAR
jgi:hypothetical protein